MNRMLSTVAVCCLATVALVGCSKDPEPAVLATQTLAPPLSTDVTTAAPVLSPGDQTQEGLEATLTEQYALIQQGDYAGVYRYVSPRCKNVYQEEQFVTEATTAWRDRDFSGPEQYLITMNSPEVATVVIKSHDGKGKMQPGTWTYINGSWYGDDC